MEIEAWLSLNRTPEAKDLADLKASILHHLQSTEGETSSWATQSRQLTAETTRPLATKFVADEAAGLVKELGRALKNIAGFDHFISEEKARGVFIANVYPAIAKATQFTAAIAPTAPAVGGETEPLARETPKRPRTFQEKHGRPASANTPTVGGETETQIFPPVDAVAEFDEHGLGEADYYTGTTREG